MLDVLEQFKTQVNSDAQIQRIVKGWNTVLALEERDRPVLYRLGISEGKIDTITLGSSDSGEDCPMRIVGDGAVIRALFEGRLNGIRANNEGLIDIYGAMSDQVKLDAIALMLWGV